MSVNNFRLINMDHITIQSLKKHKLLIVSVILIFILLLILILWINQTKKTPSISNPNQITKSKYPTATEIPKTGTPSEYGGFTGLSEITLAPEEKNRLDQENNLIEKMPLSTDKFIIGYHYSLYLFEVQLLQNDELGKQNFFTWKNTNYPDIPLEDFVFVKTLGNDKENFTEYFIHKETPFENDIFQISSQLVSNEIIPSYSFTVISKIKDTDRLKQEVNVWLQSLNLTQVQIDELEIRYQ